MEDIDDRTKRRSGNKAFTDDFIQQIYSINTRTKNLGLLIGNAATKEAKLEFFLNPPFLETSSAVPVLPTTLIPSILAF